MKVLKYILLFCYLLIMAGIAGKTLIIFPGASVIFLLGLNLFWLFGMIYGLVTLIKGRNRQEAAMIALSFVLTMGIVFKFMHWPGASFMIIIGSSILLFGSLFILIFFLSKKIKVTQAILFLSVGISSLFFCFKIMRWPGAFILLIIALFSMLVAIFFLIRENKKLNIAKTVLLSIMLSVVLLSSAKESSIYKFMRINDSMYSHPEHLYTYAWILNNEGAYEQAKNSLDRAIRELNDPNNIYINRLVESKENTLARFKRAKISLESTNWREFEEPSRKN